MVSIVPIGGYWWFTFDITYKKQQYRGDVRLRINDDRTILEWTFLHSNPHLPLLLRQHLERKIKRKIQQDKEFWSFLDLQPDDGSADN